MEIRNAHWDGDTDKEPHSRRKQRQKAMGEISRVEASRGEVWSHEEPREPERAMGRAIESHRESYRES